MFKRKPNPEESPVPEPEPEPGLDRDLPAGAEPRTTCYPQDSEAPPPVVGQPRTTVYRQAVRWNRGGYDTETLLDVLAR